MRMTLSRRSFFKGLMALTAIRVVPIPPVPEPAAATVVNTLNPFTGGNTERLTEMIVNLMGNMEREYAVSAIRSVPSFKVEMLEHVGHEEPVSEELTRQLGEGEWTEWTYSAGEVRQALSWLDRRDELNSSILDRTFYHGEIEPETASPDFGFDPLASAAMADAA